MQSHVASTTPHRHCSRAWLIKREASGRASPGGAANPNQAANGLPLSPASPRRLAFSLRGCRTPPGPPRLEPAGCRLPPRLSPPRLLLPIVDPQRTSGLRASACLWLPVWLAPAPPCWLRAAIARTARGEDFAPCSQRTRQSSTYIQARRQPRGKGTTDRQTTLETGEGPIASVAQQQSVRASVCVCACACAECAECVWSRPFSCDWPSCR